MTISVGQVVSGSNSKRATCLVAGATGTSSTPSAATDGVPMFPVEANLQVDTGICYAGRLTTVNPLVAAYTTGTPSAITLKLWGYLAAEGAWHIVNANLVTITAANGGGATTINAADLYYDRLFVEVNAWTGSGTLDVWIVVPHKVAY